MEAITQLILDIKTLAEAGFNVISVKIPDKYVEINADQLIPDLDKEGTGKFISKNVELDPNEEPIQYIVERK